MGIEENKYSQIEKYLSGGMDSEELRSFVDELKNNPELVKEINLHKELGHAIAENDVINFRNVLKSIVTNEAEGLQKTKSGKWRYLRVAAGISIIMIMTFGIYKMFFAKVSNEQLYATYYEPYEDLITGRSNEINDQDIALAMRFYSQQQYVDVVKQLEKIDKTDKPLIYLYLGISYMNIDKTNKAHEALSAISKTNNLFQIEAKWYIALNYLKKGDINKSKIVLEEIIAYPETSSYKLKAKDLLNEL